MGSSHYKPKEKGGSKDMPQVNILLAEDDKISELILRHNLKSYCKSLTKVSTGGEAVAAVRENPQLQLVLMDIRMPEMNGLEATRKIREFNKGIIIIAQSGHGCKEDHDEAIKAGCNQYIAKPVSKQALLQIIDKYFAKDNP